MTLNKKFMIVFLIIIAIFLAACSDENVDNKSISPQKNIIDSLSLVKEKEANKAEKLKSDLDSLRRHLDSIKSTNIDSLK